LKGMRKIWVLKKKHTGQGGEVKKNSGKGFGSYSRTRGVSVVNVVRAHNGEKKRTS